MNQRIRELSKQAFEYTLDRLNSGLEFRDFQPIWSEKFAELIVRDCLSIARLQRNNMQFLASNPPQSAAAYDIERNIMNHFGVEE